ncbi:MAG: single-stranded DNA-binding protein [Cytophagales bacterium]|nr:single-stranded DNA-binding protein [Cytophagales bacterium]
MSGINKVILIGNLGKNPEVRHLENGRARATFSLATNETYKNKEGEKVTNTEWHNVVLWTPFAEIAEKYLTKGKQVYIEGKLSTRSYEDKEGNMKYITEVVGQNLTLLGSKNSSSEPMAAGSLPQSNEASNPETDDLPF